MSDLVRPRVPWFILFVVSGCWGPSALCPDQRGWRSDLPRIYRITERDGSPCAVPTEVTGECRVWAEYIAYHNTQPPHPPCNPSSMSFTEVATGDCLFAGTNCPGILDDPAYADCSESTLDRCCTESGEVPFGALCDDLPP